MTGLLVPPHDLGAEQAVLSAVLTEERAIDLVAAILKPDDFYSPAHRWIFRAALALREQSEPVDGVTVAGWLKARERLAEIGGMSSITHLLDEIASVVHVDAHARIVLATARRRAMIAAAQKIVAEGYSPEGSGEDYLEKSAHALASIAGGPKDSDVIDFSDAIARFTQRLLDASRSGNVLGMSTGYARLDHAISGLHRKEVVVVAGRPGMGKSGLVLDMCIEAAQASRDVVNASFIVSAEMPPEMLAARGFCSEAQVSISAARAGNLSPAEWQRLEDAAQWAHGLPIRFMGRMGGLVALRSALREYQAHLSRLRAPDGREIRLGIVAIDYAQMVASTTGPRGKNESQEEQISNLALGLQAMSKEFDVSMIMLSQLNREVEKRPDKRPTISDLKGSGAIEAVADLILLLYRDEYYNPNTPAKEIVEVIIGKQRSGATGKLLMGFNARITKFYDLNDEQMRQFGHLIEGAQ